MIKRRDFVRGLLALVPATALAKFIPKKAHCVACEFGTSPASLADQASIWLVAWGPEDTKTYWRDPDFKYLARPVVLDKAYIERMIEKYGH